MDLFDELEGVVRSLEAAKLDYALVGALALAVHGVPRATADIDLLVLPDDVEAVLQTVSALGFRFPAAPMSFADGTRIRRVNKISGGDHLTLDLLLASDALETV